MSKNKDKKADYVSVPDDVFADGMVLVGNPFTEAKLNLARLIAEAKDNEEARVAVINFVCFSEELRATDSAYNFANSLSVSHSFCHGN